MQSIELVDIDDVYPYEENGISMNPRNFNSKEKKDYIRELAKQFRYNKLKPGQPRINPILYRDGGIYLIIDGECRYRAMKSIGTKKFWADVYDDINDAEMARKEAAKAMIETDFKLGLTSEEKSRGVQQMLNLEIPDDEIAVVSGLEKKTVAKARKATKALDGEAYDMTLDRLVAISEFDDPDDIKELTECSQKEWRKVYERLQGKQLTAKNMAAMKKVLSDRGIECVEETPQDYIAGKSFLASTIEGPQSLAEYLDRISGGAKAIIYKENAVMVLVKKKAVTKQEQEDAARRSIFYQKFDEAKHARDNFIEQGIANLDRIPNTAEFLHSLAAQSAIAQAFEDEVCAIPGCKPTPLTVALGYVNAWRIADHAAYKLSKAEVAYLVEEDVEQTAGLFNAMRADGYAVHTVEFESIMWAKEQLNG